MDVCATKQDEGQANKNAFTLSSNIPSVIKELQDMFPSLMLMTKERRQRRASLLRSIGS